MSQRPDLHKIFLDAMDKWLRVVCYLAAAWIGFDILVTLPPELANRIIEAILRRLGI